MMDKRKEVTAGIALIGRFDVSCHDSNGCLKWETFGKNMVVNVGLQKLLDILFVGTSEVINPWHVGLAGTAPTVASGDTMASHAGWNHFINYDEATRQEFTDVRTAQVVSNSAATASFTISTNGSVIGGAFLTSNNTKNGSAGVLLCAVAFTGGNKSADDNDTIAVTYTFSAADS